MGHAGKHGVMDSGKRMPYWTWFDHMRPQSPSPVTFFLKQHHAYSNKTMTLSSVTPYGTVGAGAIFTHDKNL